MGPLHPVERANEQENAERNDDEVDHEGDEVAVIPSHGAGLNCLGRGRERATAGRGFQHDELV